MALFIGTWYCRKCWCKAVYSSLAYFPYWFHWYHHFLPNYKIIAIYIYKNNKYFQNSFRKLGDGIEVRNRCCRPYVWGCVEGRCLAGGAAHILCTVSHIAQAPAADHSPSLHWPLTPPFPPPLKHLTVLLCFHHPHCQLVTYRVTNNHYICNFS